jgi:hypothetical protein
MLDQSFSKVNYVGKDGLDWFIGQVSPDAKWRDGSTAYGYRAKVRIQGAHPATNEVSDEELPWAHFINPGTFGAGKAFGGTSFALQGGETVVGFWLDSGDENIPIIWGPLFSGQNEINVNGWRDVVKNGTSGFDPFDYNPDIVLGAGNARTDGKKTENNGIVNPEKEQTPDGKQSRQEVHDNKDITISKAKKCKSGKGFMSDVARVLASFVTVTKGLQEFKGAYLDPVLGVISNIDSLIEKTADILAGAFSSLFRLARKFLFEEIYKLVQNILNFLIPDSLLKDIAIKKAIDQIYCVIENFLNGLKNFISDFLTSMIGQFVNFPLCAAEAFIAGLINDITNNILDAIGPAMNQINGIIKGISPFMDYVSKATEYAQAGLNFLKCDGDFCEPEPYDWIANFGPSKKDVIDFKKAIDISGGLDNVEKTVDETISSWFGTSSDDVVSGGMKARALVGGCNPYILECGPPTVEIFGGGGIGAAANAVVNSIGEVIGVRMSDFGVGYTKKPYVTIVDSCGNGRGATATPVMEDDKVVNIIIDNPGGGYIPPDDGSSTDDGDDVIGEIIGIDVINPGDGYSDEDTITAIGPDDEELEIEISPDLTDDGKIIGGTILTPGIGIDFIPKLRINTVTGFGGYIKPTLKFTNVSEFKSEVPVNAKLIRVIDCVSK